MFDNVVIVNFGMGNLRSVSNILHRLGQRSRTSSKPADLISADFLVLPGVGHFGRAMQQLRALDLVGPLNEAVLERQIPILGICLGMQLFTQGSEEGGVEGLGWIQGKTVKFRTAKMDSALRIPHMGWNSVKTKNGSLARQIGPDDTFYFVHSFHVVVENQDEVLLTTEYGYHFASAIGRDNIFGTQFHPEKSHSRGRQLIKNVLEVATSPTPETCFDLD